MEHGPRGPEISHDTQELLRSPEKVFDSDIEQAERQSQEVVKRLIQKGEIHRSTDTSELTTIEMGRYIAPIIQIAWPAGKEHYLLHLEPITEGKGSEGGVFGYRGSYGLAEHLAGKYKHKEKVSLEELFSVPDDLNIIIQPTVSRWAVESGEDLITVATFGNNTRKMYMGLGFLLLGREWMHIGMHEAGHLPNNLDENIAWQNANTRYAERHKPRKLDIISGKDTGEFGLLKEPKSTYYGETPRLGDVAKYGLTSHASAGNAKIPKQWDAKQINKDFQRIIRAADEAYNHFIGH